MATYKERWDAYFDLLDANGSGTITAEDGAIGGKVLTY
jgi:hypothetical protein